jgi:hypothetical protein
LTPIRACSIVSRRTINTESTAKEMEEPADLVGDTSGEQLAEREETKAVFAEGDEPKAVDDEETKAVGRDRQEADAEAKPAALDEAAVSDSESSASHAGLPAKTIPAEKLTLALITVGVFLIYLLANPDPRSFYDYTFRIAEAMLHGRLGLTETPPSWLNEMIPFEGLYYSAFPLGSVLCMIPLALLKVLRVINSMPGAFVAALLAASSAYFFFLISAKYGDSLNRRALLALFPLLGTWTAANLMFAGAWQLALGFALLGETGAIYFTLIKRRPLLAGLFFAMAFGNRTEILLVVLIFIYFLLREEGREASQEFSPADEQPRPRLSSSDSQLRMVAEFLSIPLLLGILTLAYNYARFHSILDFGYTRIPGITKEPWYQHGLFSLDAIPTNARQMLWATWRIINHKPYVVPSGFGGSIFLCSPFLILLFRVRLRDRPAMLAVWLAIVVLTFVLWLHGNPGGWQYSYRYAMILLPWMFLVLLDNGKRRTSLPELALFILSVAINAYGTYEFLWTSNVQP